MNAFLIMLGQGGMALGAILWATGVANVGLDLTRGRGADGRCCARARTAFLDKLCG